VVEPLMLGLTTYQEALRALGPLVDPASHVRIVEQAQDAWIEITTPHGTRQIGIAQLEEIVLNSHARRGVADSGPAASLSDVLRSVGLALDELRARNVCVDFGPDMLNARFFDDHGAPHDLNYRGEELDALRRTAAARRNGQPLRRVLILQSGANSAASVVELLVAEFAVQALPALYARAVASVSEAPDLVLVQSNGDSIFAAIQEIRAGKASANVPVVVLAAQDSAVDTQQAFAAGADDLLQEPVLPAQLRARLRTWLLRGRLQSE
jgi:CheY-like chemotaxis protein